MVRLAVIGAGSHSSISHGPGLAAWAATNPGRIELAAVCDLDVARARTYADQFGFAATYGDYDQMIRQVRPEALIAVTAIPQTEAIITDLLRYGLPLMIEKPPGSDSAATRRLVMAARAAGVSHMVSFNRRFNPAIVAARRWLTDHASGRPIRLTEARMLRRARRETGFAVGTGIHLIDATLSLTGQPRRVTTARLGTKTGGCFLFQSRFDLADGSVAALLIDPDTGRNEETYQVYGEGYSVFIDVLGCRCIAWDDGKEVLSWQAGPQKPAAFRDGSTGEVQAFVEAMETSRPMRPNLQDGLVSMLTAEAVQAGGEVEIPQQAVCNVRFQLAHRGNRRYSTLVNQV